MRLTAGRTYLRYSSQINPQQCFVELAPETEELSTSVAMEIGNSVPSDVWHGRVRRYPLHAALAAGMDAALLDELEELAKRVIAGYECVWDGRNYVGSLTEDAEEAEYEIRRYLDNLTEDYYQIVYDCGEWLEMGVIRTDTSVQIQDIGVITAATTDAEIESLAARIEGEASIVGILLDPGAKAWLHDERDNLTD
jgi:hypothetical protein